MDVFRIVIFQTYLAWEELAQLMLHAGQKKIPWLVSVPMLRLTKAPMKAHTIIDPKAQ